MKHQAFCEKRRQVLALGAAAVSVPAIAVAASEPSPSFDGGKIVVSGRVLGVPDGKPLAGAQVEIWRVDARGVRADATHEVVTTDGDGRYFASLTGGAQRLHYRVSHRGYTTRVTQLHAHGPQQRAVSLTRDRAGVTRASFEIRLAPRGTVVTGAPDVVAL